MQCIGNLYLGASGYLAKSRKGALAENDANVRCKAKAESGARSEVEWERQVKDN